MKRKITFLAALSAAALILAGCGETGTSTTGDASSSNDSQAPSTSVSTSEGETSASSSDTEADGTHISSSEEESLPPASNPDDSKPDTSEPDGSEPPVSTDIPAEAQGEDHGMSLMMMGGLNKNAIRSVYAIFDDKSADVELTWATDNAAVVEIYTTFGGSMPEALLSARGIGTATIYAYETGNPANIHASYEVTVAEGMAMSDDIYAQLMGGIKFTTDQSYYAYQADYQPIAQGGYDIVTVYEESRESADTITGIEQTDKYMFTMTDKDTGESDELIRVRSGGGDVATEYITKDNTIGYNLIRDEDGYTMDYDTTLYPNQFAAGWACSPASFVTTDGGKTYHFIDSVYGASYLISSLYGDSFTADDIYVTVENGVPTELTMVVDPYNPDEDAGVKYGQVVTSTISDIGTAEVPSPEPYAHAAYHDKIGTAIDNMAALENYKVTYTIAFSSVEKSTYEITMTEDTIDQKYTSTSAAGVTTSAQSGVHATAEDFYFEYTVIGGEIIKGEEHRSYWNKPEDGISRYPTFEFAPEIFEETTTENVYAAHEGTEAFVHYMAYFPANSGYWNVTSATITLDGNGHIASASFAGDLLEDPFTCEITFSDFGTASTGLDFDAMDDTVPTSWAEDPNAYFVSNLQEWTIDGKTLDQIIPYTYCPVGYSDGVGWMRDDLAVCYFDTDYFETADGEYDEALANAFIEDFTANLVAAGFVETEGKEALNNNATQYTKDGISISITRYYADWSGTYLSYLRVMVRVDDATRLVDHSDY